MINLVDYPLLVFALVFFALWFSARLGSSFLKRRRNLQEDLREDFGVILAATLTPLLVSISFFLIADIDSLRGGIVRVQPQNLLSFAQSLPAH